MPNFLAPIYGSGGYGPAHSVSLPGSRQGSLLPATSGGLFGSANGFGQIPTRFDPVGPTLNDGLLPGTRMVRRRPWQNRGSAPNPYDFTGPMTNPMFGGMAPNNLMAALSGMPKLPANIFGQQGYSGYRLPAGLFGSGSGLSGMFGNSQSQPLPTNPYDPMPGTLGWGQLGSMKPPTSNIFGSGLGF